MTKQALRTGVKDAAIKASPELADAITAFWFYDLRAKAADEHGDQAARSARTRERGGHATPLPAEGQNRGAYELKTRAANEDGERQHAGLDTVRPYRASDQEPAWILDLLASLES